MAHDRDKEWEKKRMDAKPGAAAAAAAIAAAAAPAAAAAFQEPPPPPPLFAQPLPPPQHLFGGVSFGGAGVDPFGGDSWASGGSGFDGDIAGFGAFGAPEQFNLGPVGAPGLAARGACHKCGSWSCACPP